MIQYDTDTITGFYFGRGHEASVVHFQDEDSYEKVWRFLDLRGAYVSLEITLTNEHYIDKNF